MALTIRQMLRAMGGGAALAPLIFASPTNTAASVGGVAASGAQLNARGRMPFYIGSSDMSALVLSFYGWSLGVSTVPNNSNSFNVVKYAIEKDGQSFSVPVTFGGSRTKTILAGDTDIQSDDILPSAFGLGSFTRGDKYWIRFEYSVNSAGQLLPQGSINYINAFPAAVALKIDPAAFVGSAVDSFGNISFTSGFTDFRTPYVPLVLGRPVGTDIASIFITGDSIADGAGDTTNSVLGLCWGGAQRALFGATVPSAPYIGGCKMGVSGSQGAFWSDAKPKIYLKYAKYLVEEFGTNSFVSAQVSPAAALALSQAIWTAWYASSTKPAGSILKPRLVPRTTSTDSWATAANQTVINSSWSAGGGAVAFNDALPGLVGANGLGVILPMDGVRTSSTTTDPDYYKWLTTGTANVPTTDGIHPSVAYHQIMATEYRAAYAALP